MIFENGPVVAYLERPTLNFPMPFHRSADFRMINSLILAEDIDRNLRTDRAVELKEHWQENPNSRFGALCAHYYSHLA
jgi:hypothetical protein